MTDGERLTTALVVSLIVHWAALGGLGHAPQDKILIDADDIAITDFSAVDTGVSMATPMTLEQFVSSAPSDAATPEAAAAERRREALSRYLDQLSTAVHGHRKISGKGRALVGNAIVRLTIDNAGGFSSVALLRTSGDAELDDDALQAVNATSGVVPRPKILGSAAMVLTLAVKYQFGL